MVFYLYSNMKLFYPLNSGYTSMKHVESSISKLSPNQHQYEWAQWTVTGSKLWLTDPLFTAVLVMLLVLRDQILAINMN